MPHGWTSRSTHGRKEAPGGIRTVTCRDQFVDLDLEALGGGLCQGPNRTGSALSFLGCLTCVFWPRFVDKRAHSCPFRSAFLADHNVHREGRLDCSSTEGSESTPSLPTHPSAINGTS